MRLFAQLFTAILMVAGLSAQEGATPLASTSPSSTSVTPSPAQDAPSLNLPVSLDRIRGALAQPQPAHPLLGLHDQPHFVVEVHERNPLLELLATLDFKSGPMPAGGLDLAEQQRLMFPAVDNPLRQPYAAFNQPELLTILIENLMGKYLGGRALSAVTAAERAQAQAAAREKVRRAVADFCAVQPNHGADIQICASPVQ